MSAQDVAKKRATLEAIEGTGTVGVSVKSDQAEEQNKESTTENGGSDASPKNNGPDKPAPKKGKKGGGSHLKVVK